MFLPQILHTSQVSAIVSELTNSFFSLNSTEKRERLLLKVQPDKENKNPLIYTSALHCTKVLDVKTCVQQQVAFGSTFMCGGQKATEGPSFIFEGHNCSVLFFFLKIDAFCKVVQFLFVLKA